MAISHGWEKGIGNTLLGGIHTTDGVVLIVTEFRFFANVYCKL